MYGFRSFSGRAARELGDRLREEMPLARSNDDLARRFVDASRRTRTILPTMTTIERLCADALVDAERRIEVRIAERVPPGLRRELAHLLNETVDAGVTRFVWLRQFEPGTNSAANRLLDPSTCGGSISRRASSTTSPRIGSRDCAGRGERYLADGMRERPENRRLATIAVSAVEWEMFLADAVMETHDRIVGRMYRAAVRTCEAQLGDETAAVREALRSFAALGSALIGARDAGAALDAVIADSPGWEGLGDLVATAAVLANTVASDPLNHVIGGLQPLSPLHAAHAAHAGHRGVACGQAVAGSRRRPAQQRHGAADRLPAAETQPDHRLWETAVLFHLRDAFRAGDVWLARSRRYGDIRKRLLSAPALPPASGNFLLFSFFA